ncbi:hypothetical protein B7P43_G14955, partial [Cryptotermes secundus]
NPLMYFKAELNYFKVELNPMMYFKVELNPMMYFKVELNPMIYFKVELNPMMYFKIELNPLMYFKVELNPILVRMVVSCPADASTDMLEKCAALNRSSSDFHYTMDIPVLSSASGTWYQNVYCAICNGDADNLVRLKYFLECEGNYTREKVLSEGKYSTEPLHWSLDGQHESQCRLRIELQPGAFSGFLRPCGKVNERGRNLPLIENCPVDWTDSDIAKKCKAYAFYSVWNSRVTQNVETSVLMTVLSQVFKNPDCAVCNGVPPLKTTCWSKKPSLWRVAGRLPKPSFSIVMDFMAWEDESEQYRSCRPPNGVWDVLHETCIQVANAHDNADGGGRSSRMLNHTCPTITLSASEFLILDNGSLQYTGNNSLYVGHIFDLFEILEDYTAIVCAIKYDEDNDDLISGAYEGYLTQFCLSVSVICLILHIGIYYALPKLCNLPGRNLLSLSWAILFAQAGFLLAVNPAFEVPLGVCIGFAVLEYYCFLAAFFWMNVMSVDVWRTFSRSALRGSGGLKTHCRYAGYAWGTSALIALLALTVDLSTDDGAVKPYFGRGQVCWFGNRGGLGLFLAMPLFVLLMVNSGLFANTVYWIWQARRQGARYIRDKTRDELIQTSARSSTDLKGTIRKQNEVSGVTGRKDQARFYLYLKLFVIMGLTWVFGFIAAFARVPFLWYPFILFNGLQGAFIFVMFDMKRNIACMLWDKYISRHGYKPPGTCAKNRRRTILNLISCKLKEVMTVYPPPGFNLIIGPICKQPYVP